MELQTQDELQSYLRGYEDGKRGLDAYNDSYVDLTGSLTVLRLGHSEMADAYALGFSDGLQNAARRSVVKHLLLVAAAVVLALGLVAWW
jgi:hypothetical protein